MGLNTLEQTARSARLRNLSARLPRVQHAEGRDPIIMQAIETVTAGQSQVDFLAYGLKDIAQAIYDEIRRLDLERVEAVASIGIISKRMAQVEGVAG
jgi:hypothetical protein